MSKLLKTPTYTLMLFLSLLALAAFAQEELVRTELPLSDEAISVFHQSIFLTNFASLNCENIDAERRITNSIDAIKNNQYRIVEYHVAFGSDNTIAHEYYVETYAPLTLIQIQVFSRASRCSSFSFSLISEEDINQ